MKPDTTIALPRIVIAGLSGDAGKSLVSLSLIVNLVDRGLQVAPFKKGPDYIDAAWLGRAAKRPGRNLDTFLMQQDVVLRSLCAEARCDIAVIEGNRGLFDGLTEDGAHSTAALAKLIGAPVLLVVDVTKTTRTCAASVLGCQVMDPDLDIAGVILNRCATPRQERLIRQVIEKECRIPVVGAIPRLDEEVLPRRHLGLVCVGEQPNADDRMEKLRAFGRQYLDVEAIVSLSKTAASLDECGPPRSIKKKAAIKTVGVLRGNAFSFYYPENLAALEQEGAHLIDIDPEIDAAIPDTMDGLLAGGGFPELYADGLSKNTSFIQSLRHRIEEGLPVYAECGGLMYLSRTLQCGDTIYKMAGALPIDVIQTERPAGHGYVEACVDKENPVYDIGQSLMGHEFHYSKPIWVQNDAHTALLLYRGRGLGADRDGIVQGNVFASYTHIHALGTPQWAPGFMAALT